MGNDNGHQAGEPGIVDAARRVKDDFGALGDAFSRRQNDVLSGVRQFVNDKPVAAVGIAFGIGYVLAGGLFSRTTGRLLGLGMRLGGVAMARSLLGELV